jgi:endonuclease/exonuclease/phosphatase family metal-dependent hydrolase
MPGRVMRLVREHRVDVVSLQELTPDAVRRLDAAGARDLLRRRAIEARRGATGSGLMARRILRAAGPPDDTGAQPEAALSLPGSARTAREGGAPRPPISGRSEPDWRRELRRAARGESLRILAGDFNGMLDLREMRRLLDRGYVDAADVTGDGLGATWPVGRRRPGLTIDHTLLPPNVRVRA